MPYFLRLTLLLCFLGSVSFADSNNDKDHSIKKLRHLAQQQDINLFAFDKAFDYLRSHSDKITNKNYVTVIDYTKPSTEKRLYLFDIKRQKIFKLYVSHGRGSGRKEANTFSNKPNSFQTSLGFMKTGEPYKSDSVGLALRLHGLEERNNLAYMRGIVIHGAWYVTPKLIEKFGRLGRSLGCPAVESRLIEWLIGKIQGGSLLYSFYNKKSSTKKSRSIP